MPITFIWRDSQELNKDLLVLSLFSEAVSDCDIDTDIFNTICQRREFCSFVGKKGFKRVKAEHLYSASSWEPHPQKRSGMDHTAFILQIHHTRVSPRKHSPDGATMASGSNHLITAYYSFIDPERTKGWVDLRSYLTYSGTWRGMGKTNGAWKYRPCLRAEWMQKRQDIRWLLLFAFSSPLYY